MSRAEWVQSEKQKKSERLAYYLQVINLTHVTMTIMPKTSKD